MQSVEKNEVDIKRLFNWGKKFTLVDSYQTPIRDVYIRVVGDADLNKARVYSLRKSAELRKKLKQEDSDERLAYIPDSNLIGKEELVELILSSTMRETAGEVVKEITLQIPKDLPSGSTLEEQETHQKEIDEWPEKREKLISELLEKKSNQRREDLNKKSSEELLKLYESSVINNLCENEMYKQFAEICVFFSTYIDNKYTKKLVDNLDEFLNLPTEIKQQLVDFYNTLDIRVEELKK